MSVDLKAMLEWAEEEPVEPNVPFQNKAEKYFDGVGLAINGAVIVAEHSEDGGLAAHVDSIETEFRTWFEGEFIKLNDYAVESEDIIDILLGTQERLLRMLWYRLDEEEMDEYKAIAVKNQIKEAAA